MKIVNKTLSILLIICLTVALIPHEFLNVVSAEGKDNESEVLLLPEEQEDIKIELNEELVSELNTSNSEELEVEVTEVSNETIVVETDYDDNLEQVNFETVFNLDSENIKLQAEYIDEDGKTYYEDYSVEVIEINDDSYIFNFINLKTKEETIVDSTQIQASAVPVFVYFVGAQIVRITIQKIGKKAVLKIGKKVFQQKSKDAAKKATTNFKNFSTKAGGKDINFTKAKMQHILQNHHPNYWTGKSGKSMFDPKLNVNDVKNIVTNTINSNKTKIGNALKKGESINVYKTINGVKYKVHIAKNGYVSTAHPVK